MKQPKIGTWIKRKDECLFGLPFTWLKGSFGQFVPMSQSLKKELKSQSPDKVNTGVAVKLYHNSMSNAEDEHYHINPKYRVWMDGEYEILTRAEARKLIKEYKLKLCKIWFTQNYFFVQTSYS